MSGRFRRFLGGRADFGFGTSPTPEPQRASKKTLSLSDMPLRKLDLESVDRSLRSVSVGGRRADLDQPVGETVWGDGRIGDVRVTVDSRMLAHVEIRSTGRDGSPVWLTSKLTQIGRSGVGGREDEVAAGLISAARRASEAGFPKASGRGDGDSLSAAVEAAVSGLQSGAPERMSCEGVFRTGPHCYEVIYRIAGGGVEAPNQSRVEQNVTEVSFDRQTGLLSVRNRNVESPVGRHRSHTIRPDDLSLLFSPDRAGDVEGAMRAFVSHY